MAVYQIESNIYLACCKEQAEAFFLEGIMSLKRAVEGFKHCGFDCMIVKNFLGIWCGYVGVPESHPAYNMDYQDVNLRDFLDVHGDLSFSGWRQDSLWWLGFDCGHWDDLDDPSKDKDFVQKETEGLAHQLYTWVAWPKG